MVRTPGGFAAQLNEWAAMGQQQQAFLVESVEAIESRLQTRRQLRALWQRILQGYRHTAHDVSACANTLGIGAQWLWAELTQPQPFELLFERIEARQQQDGVWKQRWPLVNLEQAIADLSERLHELRPQQRRTAEFNYDSATIVPLAIRSESPIDSNYATRA
jgi:hypothetical protein